MKPLRIVEPTITEATHDEACASCERLWKQLTELSQSAAAPREERAALEREIEQLKDEKAALAAKLAVAQFVEPPPFRAIASLIFRRLGVELAR